MIRLVLYAYMLVIILDAILSFIPQLRQQQWAQSIKNAADFTLNPIRKLLPPDLPVDPSPLVVLVLINLLMRLW